MDRQSRSPVASASASTTAAATGGPASGGEDGGPDPDATPRTMYPSAFPRYEQGEASGSGPSSTSPMTFSPEARAQAQAHTPANAATQIPGQGRGLAQAHHHPNRGAAAYSPPSPRSGASALLQGGSGHAGVAGMQAIPIPSGAWFAPASPPRFGMGSRNAHAGPSSEGARRRSDDIPPETPSSPASAPPTPSVIGTTHPPQYIHTLHPRRGSMVPLGLNIISPRPPSHYPSQDVTTPTDPFHPGFQTHRSVGFNPTPFDPSAQPPRRGSATSSSSTLTQTRPGTFSFGSSSGRERRRSSMTPSNASLAPPSPSRATASGRHSRPTSSDGHAGSTLGSSPLHARARTDNPPGRDRDRDRGREGDGPHQRTDNFGRRGSLPHIGPGGWTGPVARPWNPSLPTQRGSVGEDPLPDEGYRFGAGPPMIAGPIASPAQAALRAIETSPSGRRGSLHPARELDVFGQAEAEEAERQRRQFMAATYGEDGRRARERLSIGGHGSSPGTRRPSVMLWEKLGAAAAQRAAESVDLGSSSAPTLPLAVPLEPLDDGLGPRRGSLPMAIPGSGLGRAPSRREQRLARQNDMDAPQVVTSDAEPESDDEEADVSAGLLSPGGYNRLTPPTRPMPPLLPLSDPGPRLLPSTLALHRASHLLNSRNLQAEPLPAPLPPSLHPPAPVDLAEFDIDFILAGSNAQLGGNAPGRNDPVDVARSANFPPTPTLKLGKGGEDEDTFAKFVGEFDDEYGGRRGEWTFRAMTATPVEERLRDPMDPASPLPLVRAEWESVGAGRYELHSSGEVRSRKTGGIWRVRRNGPREYELDEVRRGTYTPMEPIEEGAGEAAAGSSAAQSTASQKAKSTRESFFLTAKCVHVDEGGIKSRVPKIMPLASVPPPGRSGSVPLRASISESTTNRTIRLGSDDKSAGGKADLSQSVPMGGGMASFIPKMMAKRRGSRDAQAELDEAIRLSVTFGQGQGGQGQAHSHTQAHGLAHAQGMERPGSPGRKGRAGGERSKSRDRTSSRKEDKEKEKDKEKKGGGLGGVFKRGLIASIKNSSSASEEKKAQREEKERERGQSKSWSGHGLSHREQQHSWIHPTGKTSANYYTQPLPVRKSSRSGDVTPSAASSTDDRGMDDRSSSISGAIEEEPYRREGKGWAGVPDDAVAMVLPIETDGANGPCALARTSGPGEGAALGRQAQAPAQALVVWFVPFNSEDDREERPTISTASSRSGSASASASGNVDSPPHNSTSLPKFQKLLRRRASREKDALKAQAHGKQARPPPPVPYDPLACRYQPLPFRSFRVVARVCDLDDLRTDAPTPVGGYQQWSERHLAASQQPQQRTQSTSSSHASPIRPQESLLGIEELDAASASTAPTSSIAAGRIFPTVIAVCHSRSQGVEFVLEGLDRLGFCQGASAWGPTGYEEWRGSGLSPDGREFLDLLWAGCTAVLGIAG